MDRRSTQTLRLDRRLIRRRHWIAPEELERELAALPDVADKGVPLEGGGDRAAPAGSSGSPEARQRQES